MNKNNAVIVGSLVEYINEIDKERSADEKIRLYRGMSRVGYKCIPSIARNIGKSNIKSNTSIEPSMIEKAKMRIPELFANDKYPVQILIKLQHYGIPTRLLDFTKNALTALYFACEKDDDANGKVIFTDVSFFDEMQTMTSPFVNAIADMCQATQISPFSLSNYIKYLEQKQYWQFTNYPNKEQLNEEVYLRISTPKFFEPELSNERLKRQQGIFLIFPNIIDPDDEHGIMFKRTLAEWQPNDLKEISIDKDQKKHIIKQLEEAGITKSFLFPEPEYICADILKETININRHMIIV